MPPVLLMTGNQTTVPLWQPLSESYDICMVGPQIFPLMADMGIRGGFSLQKYLNVELQEQAVNLTYQTTSDLHSRRDVYAEFIARTFDGNPPEPLSASRVSDWWAAMVGEHLRQEILLVGMLDCAVRENRVSGCIVHEDLTPDARVVVLFCKAHSIPTIHIPHANCFYVGKDWDIHTESICDYIAASGMYMAGWYAKWGFLPGNIRITGAPHLDTWYEAVLPSKSESRRVLGVGEKELLLVYATSWGQLTSERGGFQKEFDAGMEAVVNAASMLRATLCIKVHPGEAREQDKVYLDMLAARGVNGFVTRGYNEYVLRAADCLIAHGPSNICVQAAIIGLPSCYIPTEDFAFPNPGPFESNGNLVDTITKARDASPETWRDFSAYMNDYRVEVTSTSRAVEFIREICQ